MKKLILLFACAFTFMSCEVEDNSPQWIPELAEVTAVDLPEFFELGKTYEVDVTYLLPSACHRAEGLNATRGADFGNERRDIYIAGVASYLYGTTECDEEEDEDELEKESFFRIRIDEDEPYTFYLWTGVDEAGKNEYTVVEVPVGEPETPAEEEEEEEE